MEGKTTTRVDFMDTGLNDYSPLSWDFPWKDLRPHPTLHPSVTESGVTTRCLTEGPTSVKGTGGGRVGVRPSTVVTERSSDSPPRAGTTNQPISVVGPGTRGSRKDERTLTIIPSYPHASERTTYDFSRLFVMSDPLPRSSTVVVLFGPEVKNK